ncbi:MAG: hypothetical protein OEZ01_14665 [Candidatus Heimdallarchaeota archaeon]|nr:hypothetical protein [Candidatus Heimdallarchaeota archaeon]MDH5647251.1 hypothetical protein [Candidatus Heimdallarchaeota archaeon]
MSKTVFDEKMLEAIFDQKLSQESLRSSGYKLQKPNLQFSNFGAQLREI